MNSSLRSSHSKSSTPENRKLLFVSWAPDNTRSATLAEQFGARIFHLHALSVKRVWLAPCKYIILTARTLRVLAREKPRVVFVLNPPYFSALAVWVFTLFNDTEFILDSHTGAFIERKWTWLEPLHRFIAKRALVSIVTNDTLGKHVERWGGKYFVIGDVPTSFDPQSVPLPRPHVTVVNTFSFDEPIAEIVEAARRLPEVRFSVTGDIRRCPAAIRNTAPSNLTFTGYISMTDYINMLYSSDLAVILTTQDHTMQRGAYESVSLEVPIVTSDWPLLRETFSGGGEFCDNTAEDIARAIRQVLSSPTQYKNGVVKLKERRARHWKRVQTDFRNQFLEMKAVG